MNTINVNKDSDETADERTWERIREKKDWFKTKSKEKKLEVCEETENLISKIFVTEYKKNSIKENCTKCSKKNECYLFGSRKTTRYDNKQKDAFCNCPRKMLSYERTEEPLNN